METITTTTTTAVSLGPGGGVQPLDDVFGQVLQIDIPFLGGVPQKRGGDSKCLH